MSTNDYARGFIDALEYALAIFNRLKSKGQLSDKCQNCKLLDQMGELMLLAKEKQWEKIANELGYYLR